MNERGRDNTPEEKIEAIRSDELPDAPASERRATPVVPPPVPSGPIAPIDRPAPRATGPSIGTMLLGAILILAGLGWLLQASGVLDVAVGTLMPAALILVGVALVASSRSGTHGGLIAIGIILTLILTVASAVSIPLSGGAGEFTDTPNNISDVESEYTLLAGQRTLDLTDVDFPAGTTTIKIRTGMGQLQVDVPRGVGVEVDYELTAGEAIVLGRTQEGVFLEGRETTPNFASAQQRVSLDIEHGLGQIEVRQ